MRCIDFELDWEHQCPCHHFDAKCPRCMGTGYTLNSEGEKIVRLIEKYLDVKRIETPIQKKLVNP